MNVEDKIKNYEPLIRKMAKSKNAVFYEDYMQVARTALLLDTEGQAYLVIKNAMYNFTAELLGLTPQQLGLIGKFRKERQKIFQEKGSDIETEDLLENMNLEPNQKSLIRSYADFKQVGFLEEILSDKEGDAIKDGRKDFINDMLEFVNDNEKIVIREYYLNDLKIKGIAEKYNYNASTVGRWLHGAREKMKKNWPRIVFNYAQKHPDFYDPEFRFPGEKFKPFNKNEKYKVSNFGRIIHFNEGCKKYGVIKTTRRIKKGNEYISYMFGNARKKAMYEVTPVNLISQHFDNNELPKFLK